MRIPRFLSKIIPGFKVVDFKEWISKGHIDVYLERKCSKRLCHRCKSTLEPAKVGEHTLKIRHMDIFKFKCFLVVRRQKHHCSTCKKVRSENI